MLALNFHSDFSFVWQLQASFRSSRPILIVTSATSSPLQELVWARLQCFGAGCPKFLIFFDGVAAYLLHGRFLGRLRKLISSANVTISHCLQMFCARRTGVVEGNKVVGFISEYGNYDGITNRSTTNHIYIINISSTMKVRLGRRLVPFVAT